MEAVGEGGRGDGASGGDGAGGLDSAVEGWEIVGGAASRHAVEWGVHPGLWMWGHEAGLVDVGVQLVEDVFSI